MELNEFLQQYSLERMKDSLTIIFIDYLRNQREGLPTNFDIILDDVEAMFDLLKIIRPS